MRVCSEPGCPELVESGRCVEHRRKVERERGSRSERGYGSSHRRLRAAWQQRLDAGEVVWCWRCRERGMLTRIDPRSWTLGHCDVDRSRYHGPECPPCDYATAGRDTCPHSSHR